jgi:hypothetical protein
LHIYLSLFGLVMIVFFALTGFFLNHPAWFNLDNPAVRTAHGVIPADTLAQPDKLALVEHLRAQFHAVGTLDSFDVQDDELRVVFKSPARRVEAVIQRKDGATEVTFESRNALARLSELHRGDDAGPAWRLVIDVVAVLVLLSAGTGVVLWLLVPKWRRWGVAAIVVCVVAGLAVYWFLVP